MREEITQRTQAIFPCLFYKDARAAIEWLSTAFGFELVAVYPDDGETVAHAELRYRGGVVMLGSVGGHEEHVVGGRARRLRVAGVHGQGSRGQHVELRHLRAVTFSLGKWRRPAAEGSAGDHR